MFLNKKQTTLFLLCKICFLPALPQVAYSYEYSLRNSFCLDYARNNTNVISSMFLYYRQKNYNYCMRNSYDLILNHEKNKLLDEQKDLERQKRREIEIEKKRQEDLLIEKEKQLQENIRRRKIKNILDNANQLFR
tara:strand:+ start:328 stop:732 length:405 start_codon:yes stop_codon:yes gene_type:complete